MNIGGDSYADRDRQRKKDRVANMWEEFLVHSLSPERRATFDKLKHVDWLKDIPEDQLREAATRALQSNAKGHLLVAEWWEAVERVRHEESAAFRNQSDPPESEPEGPLVRCNACGTGIDYFSGRCGCQP